MTDILQVVEDVRELMSADKSGHGFDHVQRVWLLAKMIAEKENADVKIVSLAALLHDCDDYKLFGQEAADKLLNARRIMQKNLVDEETSRKVLEIIAHMGYSKSLKGIRPKTLEGQVVSDADMLDAIGALGVIRCLQFAVLRCNQHGTPIFDEKVFPKLGLSAEEYKKPNRKSDNFVNHFFEKLFRLKDMMFTQTAQKEAQIRHQTMRDFLYQFFREQNLEQWIEYLHTFEEQKH